MANVLPESEKEKGLPPQENSGHNIRDTGKTWWPPMANEGQDIGPKCRADAGLLSGLGWR